MFEELLLLAAGMAEQAVGRIFFGVGAEPEDRRLLQGCADFCVHRKGENWVLFKSALSLAFIALGSLDGIGVSLARSMANLAAGDEVLTMNT